MRGKHGAAAAKRKAESMEEALRVTVDQYADLKAKTKAFERLAAEKDAAEIEVKRLRSQIAEYSSDEVIKERARSDKKIRELRTDAAELMTLMVKYADNGCRFTWDWMVQVTTLVNRLGIEEDHPMRRYMAETDTPIMSGGKKMLERPDIMRRVGHALHGIDQDQPIAR